MNKIKIQMYEFAEAKFGPRTVGTRCRGSIGDFLNGLEPLIALHNPVDDRAPGQHAVGLDNVLLSQVLPGVRRRTVNPTDFLPQEWRGEVEAFMVRDNGRASPGFSGIPPTFLSTSGRCVTTTR